MLLRRCLVRTIYLRCGLQRHRMKGTISSGTACASSRGIPNCAFCRSRCQRGNEVSFCRAHLDWSFDLILLFFRMFSYYLSLLSSHSSHTPFCSCVPGAFYTSSSFNVIIPECYVRTIHSSMSSGLSRCDEQTEPSTLQARTPTTKLYYHVNLAKPAGAKAPPSHDDDRLWVGQRLF